MSSFGDLMKFAPASAPAPQAEPAQPQPSMEQAAGNATPADAPAAAQADTSYGKLMAFAPKDQVGKIASGEGMSPSNPIKDSIVTLGDRMALAAGNTRGGLSYLKKKYDDAAYDDTVGLTVKKGGMWHAVDPPTDPWAVSAELGKDIAEGAVKVVGPAAAQMVGGAVGGALGAVGGMAAGAGVGSLVTGSAGAVAGGVAGAAAGSAAYEWGRQTLGKAWGTYEATPEEEKKDIAFEGLLGMGGEVLALGAKPALGVMANVSKGAWKYASEGTKTIAAEVFGKTTMAGAPAVRTLIENSGEVSAEIGRALATHGAANAKQGLAQESIQLGEKLVEAADNGLVNQYGTMLRGLVSDAGAAGKNMAVDVSSLVNDSIGKLQGLGFGKMVKGELKPFTEKEIGERIQQGLPVQNLTDSAWGDIQTAIGALSKYRQVGKLTGERAAEALTQINKGLNQVGRNIEMNANIAPEASQALTHLSASFKNGLSATFDKAGLGEQYGAMQSLYGKYGESVKLARKLLKDDGGKAVENFLNRTSSVDGKNVAEKGIREQLIELAGKRGEELSHGIEVKNAASKFSTWLPQVGLLQGAAVAGGMAGHSVLAPVAAIPVMAAMSPRTVAGAIHAADSSVALMTRGRDFLVKMAPTERMQFMKNPEVVGNFFRTLMDAETGVDATKQHLMQQAQQHIQQSTQQGQPQPQPSPTPSQGAKR